MTIRPETPQRGESSIGRMGIAPLPDTSSPNGATLLSSERVSPRWGWLVEDVKFVGVNRPRGLRPWLLTRAPLGNAVKDLCGEYLEVLLEIEFMFGRGERHDWFACGRFASVVWFVAGLFVA